MNKKYKLYDFNNITKTLNANFYNIYYINNISVKKQLIDYINYNYSADELTQILRNVTKIIDANILNIAKQDYEPQGASVSLLISEEQIPIIKIDSSCNEGNIIPNTQHIVGHLDKSHVTVHTYPESSIYNNIFVTRIDIEISTCGRVSPLEAINYLIEKFNSDIITIDYRERGFNRDAGGLKLYIDSKIDSIQDFISIKNKQNCKLSDFNLPKENIFYTKMMNEKFEIDKHLFNPKNEILSDNKVQNICRKIKNEINTIFYNKK